MWQGVENQCNCYVRNNSVWAGDANRSFVVVAICCSSAVKHKRKNINEHYFLGRCRSPVRDFDSVEALRGTWGDRSLWCGTDGFHAIAVSSWSLGRSRCSSLDVGIERHQTLRIGEELNWERS